MNRQLTAARKSSRRQQAGSSNYLSADIVRVVDTAAPINQLRQTVAAGRSTVAKPASNKLSQTNVMLYYVHRGHSPVATVAFSLHGDVPVSRFRRKKIGSNRYEKTKTRRFAFGA